MPETGFVPTMAMALAATVVKRNAMMKTIRMAVTDCTQPSSSPKWKKTKTEMSVAIRIVRMRFIEMSRCVRSGAAAALLPPPNSETARPTAWRMIFDWRMMPMMPAMAMPPMPIGLPMKAKRFSAVKIDCGSATMSARVTPSSESIAAESTASASEPTTGTITNQTRHEPAVMIMAYFRPMIYPRPSTAAEVFSPKTTLNLSAATAPHSQMRVETDSVHSPNVPTTKSYNPPTSPATASSLACEPPFSPETRTSVVAVASGKGYLPCISLTKYLRKGISRTMPSRPPNSDERNTCQKAASRPRM